MIRKPLVTIDDIKAHRPAADIPQQRIDPYILEAQQQDLRPIMNDALYADFIQKYDNSALGTVFTNYQLLLNGSIYTYAGQQIECPGIKPIVVYFALARFILSSPININSYGIVTKKLNESEVVPPEERRIEAASLRALAISYGEQLKRFLYIQIQTYPLYGYKYSNQEVNKSGVGFF